MQKKKVTEEVLEEMRMLKGSRGAQRKDSRKNGPIIRDCFQVSERRGVFREAVVSRLKEHFGVLGLWSK